MRRKVSLSAAAFLAISFAASWRDIWASFAAESTAAASPTAVAIIDLARIFNSHTRFKKRSDALRKEVELAEAQLKIDKAEIQALTNRAGKLPEGSPEALAQQMKISEISSQLQAQVALQKKAFFEKEAGIYWDIYQEIMKEVELYAQPRGIGLVMRFHDDKMDPNDPQSIQKELNKAILYHRGIDITDDILSIVNAKPAEAGADEK